MVGNITDPSGAAVPGATVTLVNIETGFHREVGTGDSGAYSVPDLQAGRYDVKIVAPSFANVMRQGVAVSNNAVVRVDVEVQLAATSQNVTVAGSAAVLQTDRADVHTDIGAKQFQDLPVPGDASTNRFLNSYRVSLHPVRRIPSYQTAARTWSPR